MKSKTIGYLVLLVNTIAIGWLIYIATFNKLVKFIDGTEGDKGELILIPFQNTIFPIAALLISSFFFIKYIKKENI